jgi:tRNA A37 threonylcarbamoyladenosine modification protein TsaB
VRVGCMLAKALATIYKLKIYVIDSLYWQLLTPSGISLLDARGNQVYVSIYKNHKQLLKPHLMPLTKANQLIQKYHLPVYKFYQQVKVRTNFYFHYKEFKLTSPTQLVPFYIKPPV